MEQDQGMNLEGLNKSHSANLAKPLRLQVGCQATRGR